MKLSLNRENDVTLFIAANSENISIKSLMDQLMVLVEIAHTGEKERIMEDEKWASMILKKKIMSKCLNLGEIGRIADNGVQTAYVNLIDVLLDYLIRYECEVSPND